MRLNLTSSNSSKSPSSDSAKEKENRSYPSKKKSNKSIGGQIGHKGSRLSYRSPTSTVEHKIETCPYCAGNALNVIEKKIKQVIDIPRPTLEVLDHIYYAYKCTCCNKKIESTETNTYTQDVQYGNRIKGLVSYLNVEQLIPHKRLIELLEHIYGVRLSQGTISNFKSQLEGYLKDFVQSAKDKISESGMVFHADETTCMVGKKRHFMHVYSTNNITILEGSLYRGIRAMNQIGVMNKAKGTVVHDRFKAYMSYKQLDHAYCNVHVLRNLKIEIEKDETSWCQSILDLLLKAKEYKEKGELHQKRIQRIEKELHKIIKNKRHYYRQKDDDWIKEKGSIQNIRRSSDHNLFIAFENDKHYFFKFMYHKDVPFCNNQAERDLRMFKVRSKISNCFKTIYWMNVHASILSYVNTCKKQDRDILQELTDVFSKKSFNPLMTV